MTSPKINDSFSDRDSLIIRAVNEETENNNDEENFERVEFWSLNEKEVWSMIEYKFKTVLNLGC